MKCFTISKQVLWSITQNFTIDTIEGNFIEKVEKIINGHFYSYNPNGSNN